MPATVGTLAAIEVAVAIDVLEGAGTPPPPPPPPLGAGVAVNVGEPITEAGVAVGVNGPTVGVLVGERPARGEFVGVGVGRSTGSGTIDVELASYKESTKTRLWASTPNQCHSYEPIG